MEQSESKTIISAQSKTNKTVSEAEEKKIVAQMSTVGIAGNVLLSAFKLIAGLAGSSGAMISDAVHSLSDVLATFIAMIGVRISKRGADADHQYGHEKFECISSEILAGILFVTGIGIGSVGVEKIIGGHYEDLTVPGMLPLIAAIVSIVAKEAMFWYMRYYARKTDSSALLASAWHNRSDALSSVSAFIGIGFSMLGFPVMDSIASLLISIFILKAAYEIFKDSTGKMVDRSCGRETEEQIRETIMKNERVMGTDVLRTRAFGSRMYVDVEISVDGKCTLRQAHDIAHQVKDDIERNFRKVKHVMVHVNPSDDDCI